MQSTTALNRSVTPTNIFFNPRTRAECDQSQNKGLANPHVFNPRTRTECDNDANNTLRVNDVL